MSRVAKAPVSLPKGVTISVSGQQVSAKGPKGNETLVLHDAVKLEQDDASLQIRPVEETRDGYKMAGTMRALLNNLVVGVSDGFEKKLTLIGVGYRAQAQGQKLNLTLGFSHPVVYDVPQGITVEAPSQTELVVKGSNKQVVGQVAAEIRAFRPPEPYKGKGVRYADEHVVMKEAKKK
ncbi:MAG: 50S ribosomal protein L6 [Pseudomonadota bacterium]